MTGFDAPDRTGELGDATAHDPVNLAVIGLGAISQSVHLPLIRRNADRIVLTAVVDLSSSRAQGIAAASGTGVAAFDSIDALIAAVAAGEVAVDGAILATSGSHAPDVAKLVGAGIRVLAEKPLAFSLGEVETLRAVAAERGVDLADQVRVGYMKEHDPASAEAKALLQRVELRAVTVEVLHPADGAQLAFANLQAPPADVPADLLATLTAATDASVDAAIGDADGDLPKLYTNVVLGSIVHDTGLLRHLVGGIGTVDRARHTGGFPGSLSLGGMLAEHAAVPWSVDWHFIPRYPEYRETVTFHHEEGSISLVFSVPYVLNVPTVLTVVENADRLGARRSETRWMQEEAFEHELRSFAALVAGLPAPGPSVAEGAADIVVGQRMLRALAEALGTPVDAGAEASAS
ncbi:Gfo/Idh/MocA family oxidoreductase [Agromyces endophyticus]|uniref:Gfo/Idh/MocA family protein n=1 Tax=Agromyces sp. H17E-10 TaxID=2932244 RepID=UPI001FCFEB84|nr:Gfo/Idh/MocA family oxidoreductase [Agromyces sp. H17E-10]UOQ90923.1 Gfo/Idh/MocA family oxidoreductase [Agromyces sp. H17E-10]